MHRPMQDKLVIASLQVRQNQPHGTLRHKLTLNDKMKKYFCPKTAIPPGRMPDLMTTRAVGTWPWPFYNHVRLPPPHSLPR